VLPLALSALAAAAGCERPGRATSSSPAGPAASRGVAQFPTGPLATADLLPYGTTYRTEDGVDVVLERVDGPPLDARGAVAFADPGAFGFEPASPVATFEGPVPCELGMLALPPGPGSTPGPGVPPRRAATAAFGRVADVVRWDDARDGFGRRLGFTADAGTGALYDVGSEPALEALGEDVIGPLFEQVIAVGSAAVPVEGRTAAVMFDCGMGDGSYPAYVGQDARAWVVAVAVDLELHHRLTRVGP
jgi:hypothetical protein